MLFRRLAALSGIVLASLLLGSPANALTMAECSVKYNAAKDAGTLNGQTWNQFRRTQCGSDAAADESKAKKVSKSTASDGNTAKNAKKTAKSTAGTDAGAGGLTMAQCSAKYQAAKAAGTLKGMRWNDFRKARCGARAADDDTVPSIDEASYTGEPERPVTNAPKGVKFPSAISRKYVGESPARARMRTCLEQYYANKDSGALGGLRWIQKGGGYYSLCNARLKG